MSSCTAIIGRQRTKITTSSPLPSPPLFYHCLLVLLLSLHYLVCLWRHLCQSWSDTATGLKRSITWVNNSTNGYGYKLPRDWNRLYLGHTAPWCDSSDIMRCCARRSHRGHSHALCLCWFPTKHSGQLQLGQSPLSPWATLLFLLKCSIILVQLLPQKKLSTRVQWRDGCHEVLA